MTPFQKYQASTKYYLKNCEYKQVSQTTLENYKGVLDRFFEFWRSLYPDGAECDPKPVDVLAFRDSLVDNGKKTSTVRFYLTVLKLFFSTVEENVFGEELQYKENPVKKGCYPKQKMRPYDVILTDEQVSMLLENKKYKRAKDSLWARNYAIIVTLLTTGLRNSELLELRYCDIDFENQEINVEHGKGDKFRVVDFPVIAQTAILLYLNSDCALENPEPDDYVFGNRSDEMGRGNKSAWHKGTRQWLSKLVETHVAAVTGVRGVRSHDLRHICARIDLNSGSTLEELQAKLGHASMETTIIYSGRLMSRRNRVSASNIVLDREKIAHYNAQLLSRLA